jgi:uroporphyrin-3 C-methyltransferase
MTEDQNKQTKTTAATTKAQEDKTGAVGSGHATRAAKEQPKDKRRQPAKGAGKSGPDAADGKKPVGQYVRDQRRTRLFIVASSLSLLLALAALFAAYWLWQQDVTARQKSARQQEQLQQRIAVLRQQQQQAARDAGEQRQALQQRLNQQIDAQIAAIEKQQAVTVEPDWLLAEALYLIRIADHRLQLVGDVDTAISALMLADQRLFATRDPRVTAARRQVKNDINRLRALPDVDTVGNALSLSSLQQQVATLPLNQATRHSVNGQRDADDADGKTGFLDSIVAALKGLVSIRRVDDKATAIVPPEQRAFLFQNLALKLEAARFALLSRDDALYHQSLSTVSDWLARYFDARDSSVQAMQSTIGELNGVKLDPELPDLGASLQAVQAVMSRRQQAAQQAAEREESASPAAPSPAQQQATGQDGGAAGQSAADDGDSGQ